MLEIAKGKSGEAKKKADYKKEETSSAKAARTLKRKK